MIQDAAIKGDKYRWRADANCYEVPTELFYPPKGNQSNAIVKKIITEVCDPCPVRGDCLRFGLENNEKHGIWGGSTEKERRDMKRKIREGRLTTITHRGVTTEVNLQPIPVGFQISEERRRAARLRKAELEAAS